MQRATAVVANAHALLQDVNVILTCAEIAGLGKLPTILPHVLFVSRLEMTVGY